jgi:hypothetical protein
VYVLLLKYNICQLWKSMQWDGCKDHFNVVVVCETACNVFGNVQAISQRYEAEKAPNDRKLQPHKGQYPPVSEHTTIEAYLSRSFDQQVLISL